MALRAFYLEPCTVATGLPTRGTVWYLADLESERPSSPMVGDECFCKDTKKTYTCTALGPIAWEQTGGSGGGGAPSDSVVALDGSSAAGSATQYSRGDHKHPDANRPSSGEKAALAGTTGTPGSGNKYVTDTDARNTNARTPTAHVHAAADINSGTLATARLGGGSANSSTFLRGDQTCATPPSGGGPSVVKSTADQTKADATLINVTNCSFALTAGAYYKFQFLIPFRSTVSTVGLKIGLTFPTVTVQACTAQIPIAAAGAGGVLQGYIVASGGSVLGTAVPAINTDYLAVVDGFILPSANGTLQLQFAAETTGATVTCRNGACGVLYTL